MEWVCGPSYTVGMLQKRLVLCICDHGYVSLALLSLHLQRVRVGAGPSPPASSGHEWVYCVILGMLGPLVEVDC